MALTLRLLGGLTNDEVARAYQPDVDAETGRSWPAWSSVSHGRSASR